MADSTGTTTTATSTDTSTTEPAASATDTTEELGDAGKKALEAERRARRAAEKQTSDLTARLKELEDRDKTETQKLADRAAAAEKAASDAIREATRLRVIAEVQLDPELHEFVTGDTEDEIRARAEKLKARSGGDQSTTTQPAPRPDLSQGARGTGLSGDEFDRQVAAMFGVR